MALEDKMLDFEITFYEKLLEEKPDFIDAMLPLAEAYTQKGLYEKGLEVDHRLAVLLPDDSSVFYNLSCSYALTGQKEKAVKALEQSLFLGYDDMQHLLRDSDLKSLYDEPAFKELLKKYVHFSDPQKP